MEQVQRLLDGQVLPSVVERILLVALTVPRARRASAAPCSSAVRRYEFSDAVLEAVLLLDESVTPGLLAGMALVAAGLYLTNKPR